MSKEIELKLSLPARAHTALARHPLIQAAPHQGKVVTLVNTYFDTADRKLQRHGIALRTRKQGRVWLQTVKCATPTTGGLSSRPEWEGPWGGEFDFSAVDLAPVRKRLERYRATLVPLFTTNFRRDTRLYSPSPELAILIMIDRGEVSCGDAGAEPISEVELELVRGRPADLVALAQTLARDLPLCPEDRSKAERGYRLFLRQPAKPLHAAASPLTPELTPRAAFRRLAEDGLRQWQANVAGAAAGDDPEFVHQLRVALRRLRSALRLFAPVLPTAFVADWSARCGEIAGAIGAMRDLDALEAEILAPVRPAAAADGVPLEGIQALLDHERAALAAHARPALDPAHQGRLMLDLMADLDQLAAAGETAGPNLGTFAAAQLEAAHARALKRLERAADGGAAHLHALRIALKRLRYGLDFFGPLLPPKLTARQIRALARAQDTLGYLHDLSVARERLGDYACHHPDQALALGYVVGWHSPQRQKHEKQALAAADALLHARQPWTLAQ